MVHLLRLVHLVQLVQLVEFDQVFKSDHISSGLHSVPITFDQVSTQVQSTTDQVSTQLRSLLIRSPPRSDKRMIRPDHIVIRYLIKSNHPSRPRSRPIRKLVSIFSICQILFYSLRYNEALDQSDCSLVNFWKTLCNLIGRQRTPVRCYRFTLKMTLIEL